MELDYSSPKLICVRKLRNQSFHSGIVLNLLGFLGYPFDLTSWAFFPFIAR